MDKCVGLNNTFCLIMFDIDDFKHVNDTYGHDAGDAVLKNVSSVLLDNLRADDKVFRWGGEEFLMILLCDCDQARTVINRCIENVSNLVTDANGIKIRVTVSAGLVEHEDGKTSMELVNSADNALYESKHTGKNKLTVA